MSEQPQPVSGSEPLAPDTPELAVQSSWASRHPMAVYSLGRFVLFAVPFALLYPLFGFLWGSSEALLWALLIAFVFSAIASIFVLRKQREALSGAIATRADRANQKMAERSAAEDDWDEAQRGTGADSDPHGG